ncbi:MAG: division/cell wall cluster transcriptional repressor MraZ [Lachnospiraceae bacterium]|nr:division/cell wall cluster transcriptional repressor MraZ [Candidatus Darwinimomas equi]
MFMGEFNHTVDAKGRVIVPSKFRDKLGETFVITKGFDRCLSIYDMENWRGVQEKLAQMPMLTEDSRTIRRMMVGSASESEFDKQGRVLIPAPLREYAGISKDAVMIGNIDHIEIWDKDAWIRAQEIDADSAAEKLYQSGIVL